jgi:amidase
MIGVIGVAPAGEAVSCRELGYHGGNLDFNDIAVGATVHFPVNVAGGLLALGDAHASMGFCEVHSGVNIDAEVRLRVERAPAAGWRRPWFETADEIMTIGVEDRLEAAIRAATAGMVELLQQRLGLSHTDAIIVAGSAVDIRLGQAANFGTRVSAYAAIPKSVIAGHGSIVR